MKTSFTRYQQQAIRVERLNPRDRYRIPLVDTVKQIARKVGVELCTAATKDLPLDGPEEDTRLLTTEHVLHLPAHLPPTTTDLAPPPLPAPPVALPPPTPPMAAEEPPAAAAPTPQPPTHSLVAQPAAPTQLTTSPEVDAATIVEEVLESAEQILARQVAREEGEGSQPPWQVVAARRKPARAGPSAPHAPPPALVGGMAPHLLPATTLPAARKAGRGAQKGKQVAPKAPGAPP